jgi:hypothetical protein
MRISAEKTVAKQTRSAYLVTVTLRVHPLMSYRGVSNWPPVWTWIAGEQNKRPKGEVGVLRKIGISEIEPGNRCFLCMEYEEEWYIGCVLFDDPSFCRQIANLLHSCRGRGIAEIGDLDLSPTL